MTPGLEQSHSADRHMELIHEFSSPRSLEPHGSFLPEVWLFSSLIHPRATLSDLANPATCLSLLVLVSATCTQRFLTDACRGPTLFTFFHCLTLSPPGIHMLTKHVLDLVTAYIPFIYFSPNLLSPFFKENSRSNPICKTVKRLNYSGEESPNTKSLGSTLFLNNI